MRVLADAKEAPRAIRGRAPDVFRAGGWVPMREYADDELVDFAIVGTGAGGGTLACKLAEYGFSVVALDAGPYWWPLDFRFRRGSSGEALLDRRTHRRWR
jgi:NADPH-dependent 2,4-dienoyl-CoA reductase/sulfur reductase-like enzyme